MKKFQNEVVKGWDGKPLKSRVQGADGQVAEEKELKLENVLWIILNNAPLKTQNDSIQGQRLAKALDKAKDNGVIEMEEGVHDWIKPIAEQLTPGLFRINGNNVYELIKEGFEKEKQPKEKVE